MKALSRAILAMLILLPMSLSAHPAKGPKNKKKKSGPKAVVTETVVVKKGKKKHGKTVVVKKSKKGKRARHRNHSRRVELLLSGRSWVKGPIVVYGHSSMSDIRFNRLIRRLRRAHGPQSKLGIVANAARHDRFSVSETRLILREFRSQGVRLEALEILSYSIVGRRKLHRILRAFESPKAKRRAAMILADI